MVHVGSMDYVKKVLVLFTIALCATTVLVFAQAKTARAAVPQLIGVFDTTYANLKEADCRSCHGAYLADRHHMSPLGTAGNCTACHMVTNGVVQITRDCKICHTVSEHHSTDIAKAGICTACHDPALVVNFGSVPVPTSVVSSVTPAKESCRNCHAANAAATPFPIGTPYDLHHGTGLAGTTMNLCSWCHGTPSIRYCENCHSVNTLHAVQGHQLACSSCHSTTPPPQPPPPPAAPTITSLDPNSGPAGSQFYVFGTGFGATQSAGRINFGATTAAVKAWTDTVITVTVPNLPNGDYTVTVYSGYGTSDQRTFTVVAPPRPVSAPDCSICHPKAHGFVNPDANTCDTCHTATPHSMSCTLCHGAAYTMSSASAAQAHQVHFTGSSTNPNYLFNNSLARVQCDVCHAIPLTMSLAPDGAYCGIMCHATTKPYTTAALPTIHWQHVPKGEGLPYSCYMCHGKTIPVTTSTSCGLCHAGRTFSGSSATVHQRHGKDFDCSACHQNPQTLTFDRATSCQRCHSTAKTYASRFDIHQKHIGHTQCWACHGSQDVSADAGFTCASCHGTTPVYTSITDVHMKHAGNGYGCWVCHPQATTYTPLTEASTGAISGKVTNAVSGAVLLGATVTLDPGGYQINTGTTGTYALSRIPTGVYTVTVSLAGHQTLEKTVTVVQGQTLTLDFVLTPLNVTVPFDQALYVQRLSSTTTADGSGSKSDVTNAMKDGNLTTAYTLQTSSGDSRVLGLKVNQDASKFSKVYVRVYTASTYVYDKKSKYYDKSKYESTIRIYPYKTDGVTVNTAVYVSVTRSSSGWNEIDVTTVAAAMKGFGWQKFRVVATGNSFKVSEGAVRLVSSI